MNWPAELLARCSARGRFPDIPPCDVVGRGQGGAGGPAGRLLPPGEGHLLALGVGQDQLPVGQLLARQLLLPALDFASRLVASQVPTREGAYLSPLPQPTTPTSTPRVTAIPMHRMSHSSAVAPRGGRPPWTPRSRPRTHPPSGERAGCGGRSCVNARHTHPLRVWYRMALTISRRRNRAGRPPGLFWRPRSSSRWHHAASSQTVGSGWPGGSPAADSASANARHSRARVR